MTVEFRAEITGPFHGYPFDQQGRCRVSTYVPVRAEHCAEHCADISPKAPRAISNARSIFRTYKLPFTETLCCDYSVN